MPFIYKNIPGGSIFTPGELVGLSLSTALSMCVYTRAHICICMYV